MDEVTPRPERGHPHPARWSLPLYMRGTPEFRKYNPHMRPSKRETMAMRDKGAPQAVRPVIAVPLPADKIVADYSGAPSRDGQADFRAAIVAAYGQCAVTGCTDNAALEAAHIVPYVNAASNIIGNGLCLRADIHKLFDRNLITISEDGTITVSPRIKSAGYRSLDGRAIHAPANKADKPDPTLLAWRLRVLGRD